MLLIYTDPTAFDPDKVDAVHGEYFAFTQSIVQSGELVAGDALQGSDTATTVRVRNGKASSTDGPFAETKEVLGGFYIVNVPTLERAQELAAKIPGAKTGSVEVRPLLEMPAPVER
jgi:hypothetical protein